MVHPAPTNTQIIHAYRHLLLLAARAVQHSPPARMTLQTRIRLAFRLSPAASFDPIRIRNTLTFLANAAARPRSPEASVVKRLAFTWHHDVAGDGLRGRDLSYLRGWEHKRRVQERSRLITLRRKWERSGELPVYEGRMDTFRHTVRMLNESMGLCLW